MEQAIIAMLGIIITLILYLDRGRRADTALLRTEMHEGFAQLRKEARADNEQLRKEARADNKQLRKETRADNEQLRKETNEGFKRVHERLDKLTDVVMDLCRRVGRLEGRAEATEPTTAASS